MSQPEQQAGGASSIASASVTATPVAETQPVINSDDPAWAHCSCPDIKKKHSLKCNYCDKKINAGITRVKYHLAKISGFNVSACKKVPTPVQEEMAALINKKDGVKEQKRKSRERDREGIDIDKSDGERSSDEDCDTGNEVVLLRPSKGSASSRVVASGGTIDKFYKPRSVEESVENQIKGNISAKVQAKLTTQKREERRDRVCEYICQFFYEASIPHNTVTLPSFAHMVEAIGQFGRGLRGPSPYEMSGPFLQKRKRKVLDGFKEHEESWQLTGCTVMTDAWTDKRGRGIMNLVVHCAHGVCFLDSVNCSAAKKDGKYIFELVDKCIEDIGEENVIQVVTDNASVNVTAAGYLAGTRKKVFWNGCAAHCLDLMLEDIGKLEQVDKTIADARLVTSFLYAHTRVLYLMREILGRDLVRSGITRFATAYLNLKSLQDNKKELARLFRTDELNDWGYLKKEKGKKAIKVVRSETFWKTIDNAINFFEPLANVLRRMDSDVPSMGFFHGSMLEAKKEISVRFDNDESKFKVVWDIIDKRWNNKLKTPLHLAGYYLNPYYYYPRKAEIEKDGSFRAAVIECTTRLFDDEQIQDSITEELNMYQAQQQSFGHDIAIRQRKNKNFNPAKWWMNHGTCTPNLRLLAMKILNLTCSSSACERNWSTFEQVQTKKRCKLLHDRMRDLVFVKFNSKLKQKRESKCRDPIEKEIDDVLADENNEFIIGAIPNANAEEEPEVNRTEQVGAKAQPHEEFIPQPPAKRKRPVGPKKKKLRSIRSLMRDEQPEASASSTEAEGNQDDDVSMHFGDSTDSGDD